MKTTLLDHAIRIFHELHFSQFFVHNKKPLKGQSWKSMMLHAPGERELREMFRFEEINGIAVVSGKVSDYLAVRDFDTHPSYEEFKRKNPKLAAVCGLVRTHKGGHVYFIGESFYVKLADGEYRGTTKQYTVTPPSCHPLGTPYEWENLPKKLPVVDDPVKEGLLPKDYTSSSKNGSKVVKVNGKDDNSHDNESTIDNSLILSNVYVSPPGYVANTLSGLKDPVRHSGWMPPDAVEMAARLHQPMRVGERHDRIFNYVRALKGLSDIKWDTYRAKVAFKVWWADAVHVVGTKDESLSLREFYSAWGKCKHPVNRLDSKRLLVTGSDVELPLRAEKYSDNIRALLRVCITLHRINGGVFFLSCEDAGKLIGVSKQAVQRFFHKLIKDGFLELVFRGSNSSGKASVYRYRENQE